MRTGVRAGGSYPQFRSKEHGFVGFGGPREAFFPPTRLAVLANPWHGQRVSRFSIVAERVLPLTILVVAAMGVPILMLSPEGLPRLRSLETEIAQVRTENAELSDAIEVLKRKVRRLKEDPKAVESLARDELGLVRNTEVVFQFAPQR